MEIRIVIPSYGRAEVLARKNPYVEQAIVAVDKPQVAEYQTAFAKYARRPAELIPLPETNGAGRLRNACLDRVWTEGVDGCFFLDDDVEAIVSVCGYRETRLGVDEGVQAIRRTCASAAEAGTGVCGFGTKILTEFRSFTPITVIGHLDAQSIGIVDRDLRFDPLAPVGDGLEICLRSVIRYGFIWKDNRLRVRVGPNWAPGGSAKWRTRDVEHQQVEYINAKYRRYGGNVIGKPKHVNRPGLGGALADEGLRRIDFGQIRAAGP